MNSVLQGTLPLPERACSLLRAALTRETFAQETFSSFGFASISSTMDVASAVSSGAVSMADLEPYRIAGHGPNLVFLARTQTKGRGRKQRQWLSTEGLGLYVTYVFPTRLESAALSGLSLVLGLASQRCIKHLGADAQLKWPNDLLAKVPGSDRPRKLGGILVEVAATRLQPDSRAVLAGVGLNLKKQTFPSDIPGASLEELLREPIVYEEVFSRLTSEIGTVIEHFFQSGFAVFSDEWNKNSGQTGLIVTVETADGVSKTGTVLGVAKDGALRLLEGGTGTELLVYSGEIV